MNVVKQAFNQIKAQKMLAVVSIVGIALSIFLIMVVVMLQQVKVAPFAPESNRGRFLHARMGSIKLDGRENYESNGPISFSSGKELFYSLETPEEVTLYTPSTGVVNVNLPGQPSIDVDARETDDRFWRVFDFTFVAGKPYDLAAFESGLPQAVIAESVARRLFGSTDVVGREALFNHAPYTIVGVVKDVSSLADSAYGQAWCTFTSTGTVDFTWGNGLMGSLSATILARNPADFDAIRTEYESRVREFNKAQGPGEWQFITRNRPYDQEKSSLAFSANIEPDVKAARRERLIVFVILLIVPAINLSSMTDSRLRRRIEEIGVRRAFGCRRSEMFANLLTENLIVTLIAGCIGWLLSVVFAKLFNSFLFAQPYSSVSVTPHVDMSMLIQPATFFWALLFCFILNLLSTGIPAWKASRTSIVNALK